MRGQGMGQGGVRERLQGAASDGTRAAGCRVRSGSLVAKEDALRRAARNADVLYARGSRDGVGPMSLKNGGDSVVVLVPEKRKKNSAAGAHPAAHRRA